MKKLFIVLALALGLCSVSHAVADVWQSSSTITADTTKVLCGSGRRGHLYSVVISSPGAAGAGIIVYNSSFTTSTNFVAVDGRTIQNPVFSTQFPKGMMYSTTGAAQTAILYNCY